MWSVIFSFPTLAGGAFGLGPSGESLLLGCRGRPQVGDGVAIDPVADLYAVVALLALGAVALALAVCAGVTRAQPTAERGVRTRSTTIKLAELQEQFAAVARDGLFPPVFARLSSRGTTTGSLIIAGQRLFIPRAQPSAPTVP